MRKEPIVSSVVWVAGTWWVGLTCIAVGSSLIENGNLSWVSSSTERLSMAGIGIVVGCLSSYYLISSYRKERKSTIAPTKDNNSIVTLGKYPGYWNLNYLEKIKVDEDLVSDLLNEIKTSYPYLHQWLQTDGVFRAPFLDVLRVYLSRPQLSATTRSGFHGGLTSPVILVDHALAVADKALQLVPNFRYIGLKSRPKGMPTLNPRDPHYMPETFHDECPIGLIALTAFAHDIGKIKTFVEDDNGAVIEANGKHGPVGARLVTHIPSVMKLHPHHVRAITSVLAHYHACHTLPLDRDYRTGENLIRDDKTVAIMEIVIAADKAVCGKETASVLSLSDYESDALDFTIESSDRIVWESMYVALAPAPDKKHINGGHHDRIGFKYKDKVFLIEEALNKAVLSNLGSIQPPGDKGGVNTLTEAMLTAFDKRGLLCTDWEGSVVPASQSIFKVLFVQPPEMVEKQGERKPKQYQRMIVIKTTSTHFDFSYLPDSPMIPSVEAPTLGKHRAKAPPEAEAKTEAGQKQPNAKKSSPKVSQPKASQSNDDTTERPVKVSVEAGFDPESFAQALEKPQETRGKRGAPQRKNARSGVPIAQPEAVAGRVAEGLVSLSTTIADVRAHIPALQVVLSEIIATGSNPAVIRSEWEKQPCIMVRVENMPKIYPAFDWISHEFQALLYANKTKLILHKNSSGRLILVVTL